MFISVLIFDLIFMHFSYIYGLLGKNYSSGEAWVIFLKKSALVDASTDLLLLHMTSQTDKHGDLGDCMPPDFLNPTHTQKLYFRKSNLSAYTCMHYNNNLDRAALVCTRRMKIFITKNLTYGFFTKTY